MKTIFSKHAIVALCAIFFLSLHASAQVQEAKLQASGLTCSMCSKAVLNALQKVPVVQKVAVDIDRQEYGIIFKQGVSVDLDALKAAVEDAGFSIAKLQITAAVPTQKLSKDQHVSIAGKTYHFLNGAGRQLASTATFQVVDKNFVSIKEAKKWSAASAMACVKTGRMAPCCSGAGEVSDRVYHVIL